MFYEEWAEPHKVDGRLRQPIQRHQDAARRVHIWQEGHDVIFCDCAFDLRRRAQHGDRTVWHPEGKVQLEDSEREETKVRQEAASFSRLSQWPTHLGEVDGGVQSRAGVDERGDKRGHFCSGVKALRETCAEAS